MIRKRSAKKEAEYKLRRPFVEEILTKYPACQACPVFAEHDEKKTYVRNRSTDVHELIRRGLSLVPEGRGLFPQMSVEENLLMGGYSLTSKPRRKELMENCYDLFPILKERRNQYAGTLSGGQQQMVAVSVGLMGDPKLCIFDEPSLGLAPIVIQQIGETLQKMRALNLTVLLIEQNAMLASHVADRIYIMSAGRVQFHDTPASLMQNPEVIEKFLSA